MKGKGSEGGEAVQMKLLKLLSLSFSHSLCEAQPQLLLLVLLRAITVQAMGRWVELKQ